MQKEIRYDRETRDYAMYLNGEYIGSRERPEDAERELDELAIEQLEEGVAL